MQIYNCLFEKLNEMSFPLSYAEVLYRLYRDHFPPHPLMYPFIHADRAGCTSCPIPRKRVFSKFSDKITRACR